MLLSANRKFSYESLVNESNLRPISSLEKGTQIARSVARIVLANLPNGETSVGTGFLIDADTIMTNNHVIPSKEIAKGAKIQFNYQTDLKGTLLPVEEYECDCDSFFQTDSELDFTIVKVKGSPGLRWGFIPYPGERDVKVGNDVFIIQHPKGMPKMVSLSENVITYCDNKLIQYVTDTLGGSSGSPVFNDNWELIALHHGSIPSEQGIEVRNEGISVTAIKKRIRL
ncbi:hypothetical protein PAECIP111893_00557 [Paenibacillus plantiphilus]|uniref:Serine protease n=1 Tax=Paenibacillus plantiphilus TaxID=2905650 RepID=A0ABM9BUA1_9BACL|nr:serine protease [Paenibacillus plantiphilus]CAH1193801.1 hypothetical protein PAECIP111893_00557 [Paenibacillus plantiphilus]